MNIPEKLDELKVYFHEMKNLIYPQAPDITDYHRHHALLTLFLMQLSENIKIPHVLNEKVHEDFRFYMYDHKKNQYVLEKYPIFALSKKVHHFDLTSHHLNHLINEGSSSVFLQLKYFLIEVSDLYHKFDKTKVSEEFIQINHLNMIKNQMKDLLKPIEMFINDKIFYDFIIDDNLMKKKLENSLESFTEGHCGDCCLLPATCSLCHTQFLYDLPSQNFSPEEAQFFILNQEDIFNKIKILEENKTIYNSLEYNHNKTNIKKL